MKKLNTMIGAAVLVACTLLFCAATSPAVYRTPILWVPVRDTIITRHADGTGWAQPVGPQHVASIVRSNVVYQIGFQADGVMVWRVAE